MAGCCCRGVCQAGFWAQCQVWCKRCADVGCLSLQHPYSSSTVLSCTDSSYTGSSCLTPPPASCQALYKTVWEIKQRVLVDMAADRGAFIDQSQSFNVHMSDPNFGKLTSLHFHAWRKGLKTGAGRAGPVAGYVWEAAVVLHGNLACCMAPCLAVMLCCLLHVGLLLVRLTPCHARHTCCMKAPASKP